jgi:hypothetical protein
MLLKHASLRIKSHLKNSQLSQIVLLWLIASNLVSLKKYQNKKCRHLMYFFL